MWFAASFPMIVSFALFQAITLSITLPDQFAVLVPAAFLTSGEPGFDARSMVTGVRGIAGTQKQLPIATALPVPGSSSGIAVSFTVSLPQSATEKLYVSFPSPPLLVSLPSPALIESSPAPPSLVSTPPPALIWSSPPPRRPRHNPDRRKARRLPKPHTPCRSPFPPSTGPPPRTPPRSRPR